MRRESENHLVLSERNLLSLLTKLNQAGSARTIESPAEADFSVSSETDIEHYGARGYGPGPMHPATERLVALLRENAESL